MHLTDAALVEQCLNGEKDAFAEIVKRYQHRIYYISLTRMRDRYEADDFAARVMAALHDRPRLTWRERLGAFWPERRFWPIPAVAGALVLLVIMAGFTLIRPGRDKILVPVVLDLYAPSAKHVDLIGSFTGWNPGRLPLQGPDAVGYWRIAIKLPPQRYEYAFLINGSRWVPDDDGEVLCPDGLGHENSVLALQYGIQAFEQPSAFVSDEYLIIPQSEETGEAPSFPDKDRGRWQAILEKGMEAGFQRLPLERALARLATTDFSPNDAEIILGPLFQEARSDTRARHVLLKLQEGVLKKTTLEALESMTRGRDESFKRAEALLARTGHTGSIERDPTLLDVTAFALESGQDPSSLHEVLSAGRGKPVSQIAAVIEAGEILYRAGLRQETLSVILKDCLEKDLSWEDLKHVKERVKEKLEAGVDHQIIRDELWV